jgi:hypothetical protein
MLRTTLEGDTMAHDDAARAYEDLTFSMSEDEDFDVAVAADGLLVRGKLFAFLEGDDLVVELPEVRAKDLKERGVAYSFSAAGHPSRDWVRVSDLQLWPELARESHEFVGEPRVGGDS